MSQDVVTKGGYEVVEMSQLFAMRSDRMNVTDVGRLPMAAACHAGFAADASVELLRTISEVLDIRRVFPRVSEIASHVLPHDCLELVFLDGSNHLTLQARSTDAFPDFRRLAIAGEAQFQIVNDLRTTRLRLALCDPPDFVERVVAAGYRSLLVVRSHARHQAIGLVFFSKRADAFTPDDVPAARQIADYVALAVSHEQLAEVERQDVEARIRAERLDARVQSMTESADRKSGRLPAIGQSAEWKGVLKKATQVAPTETTVLLHGESGTGKEVIARLIHRASVRRGGPFVAINCAALPEHLLESELFGYERGAFTGAAQPKPGQIELAAGGVLFLDEVSEMSPAAQAKLLRVLQEREFLRLGGTRLLKANVRVIAATNRDLREAVARGAFREDLYYRLQVFDIRIPPLRDRASDIPLFVEAFLEDIGRSLTAPAAGLTPEATAMLVAHRWPGNVRELRNVLERAAILCEGGCIAPQHLSLDADPLTPPPPTTDLRTAERRTIEQVLRETDGNKAKAARRLGLTRTQLYVRLRKYEGAS
jgi:transcriptional regulator with GAF, ATPase, and Fis domain